jgi:hypothetical protein
MTGKYISASNKSVGVFNNVCTPAECLGSGRVIMPLSGRHLRVSANVFLAYIPLFCAKQLVKMKP